MESVCFYFKEAGDRIVAVAHESVLVYENDTLLHICEKKYGRKC